MSKNCQCGTSTDQKRRIDVFLSHHFRGFSIRAWVWLDASDNPCHTAPLTVINVHNIACIYTIIQMPRSYLNVGYERDSSHIYSSSDFRDDVFTMKVLFSALTRYVEGGVSTCQLLVSLKLEKVLYRKYHSFANTIAYCRTACGSEISS